MPPLHAPTLRRRRAGSPSLRWWIWTGIFTLGGLGIRLGTVFGRPNRQPGDDAYYYHYAANLLVEGKGFINPWYWNAYHEHIQIAAWPPLFVFVLAMTSVVGLKSFFAHRIWCCIVGAAAIVMTALAGREIAGRRVGLLAAFLVAVYPNIWMSDELALSETISPLLIAFVLWASYRFWKRPSWQRAVVLGVGIALTALARDELTALAVLIILPVTLFIAKVRWSRRLAFCGLALLAFAAVIAPWVGYNMSRFKDPVFITDGLGTTLASADCAQTWSGTGEGYWSYACQQAASPAHWTDESVRNNIALHHALKFIEAHKNRWIPVALAKIGRGFGFFHPMQQIKLDSTIETRPYHWALVGLGMYYVLFALSIGGTVVLWRRKIPVWPLLAIGVNVVAAMVVAFGNTRYRTPFEVSLVLLAAVQLEWIWSRLSRRRRSFVGASGDGGAGERSLGEGALGTDAPALPGVPDHPDGGSIQIRSPLAGGH